MPKTVSVGKATTPPDFKICMAFFSSSLLIYYSITYSERCD
jgi:hypothetical protein